MPDVEVTHSDGTTETIPGVESSTETDRYGEMSSLTLGVARSDALAVDLNPKSDLLTYEGETYRLVNIDPATDVWTLEAKSREWDAKRVPPLPGGEKREGTDKELIEGLIAEVPDWTAGSIAELTGPMTFVFNHARPNEAIRRVEKNVPGVVSYAGDGTVTYEAPPAKPSDPTTVPEISADAENIDGRLKIEDVGREVDGTHIRVLGAHEGEAQFFAQLVPNDDPNTYENEVRYTTSRYTEPADTDWDRWENKDVVGQDTIEEEARSLAQELDSSHFEVRTTKGVVPDALPAGVTLERGDWVRAVKATGDFDELVRIHEVKRIREGTTVRLKLVMSTRQILFDEGDKPLADVQRYNLAFQGASVVVSNGPVYRAVDAGNPLEFGFRYPDVEFEDVAEVRIEGLPYRVDSSPAEHSHPFTVPDHVHDFTIDIPDHFHTVDINTTSDANSPHTSVAYEDRELISLNDTFGGWEEIDNFFPNTDYEFAHIHVIATSPDNVVRIRAGTSSSGYFPSSSGVAIWGTSDRGSGTGSIIVPEDIGSVPVEFQSDSDTGNISAYIMFVGRHDHDVDEATTSGDGGNYFESTSTEDGGFTSDTTDTEAGFVPGIFETADVPSGVDLVINGTTVATNVGGGTFQTTVDVAGELNPDAWNTIRVESDSLGVVSVSAFLEAYKQIGTTQ